VNNFLAACRSEPHDRVPVWFMRQAGRSLPEYRALRGDGSILDAIRDPKLAAEFTLQPVRRYGVDAAILYSDIVVPVAAIGFGVDVAPGTGPVVARPFASKADLDRLRPLDAARDTPYVIDAINAIVDELPDDVPLIGFAGAPFTVASYLVEGRPSRDYVKTKALMLGEPDLWRALMDKLADLAVASLRSQIEAGARAVQLFDSWAGALTIAQYVEHVLPASTKVFAAIADLGVPRIHFGVNTTNLLPFMAEAGAEVLGFDWRTPLTLRHTIRPVAVQGNLDPAVCFAPWPVVEREVRLVLSESEGAPGYIFNLGHGVMPETDPAVLARIVDLVHAEGRVA